MNRRELLVGGGALSIGVLLGCHGDAKRMIRRADETGELAPNMYVTVLPNGRIALAVNKTEIGQGVTTGFATLVAEELGVDTEMIDFHFADSFPEYRTSFGMHQTGGSTSMKEAYLPVRRAAAAAREMLVAAAASSWGVKREDCTVAGGKVVHASSGKSAGYGELTKQAAHQPVPEKPTLVAKAAYKQIGKLARRVDAVAKVTGTATFGIDVSVPGMVKAAVVHGPVFGSEPRAVKDAAARALPGVHDVLTFPWGVAVVADKYWQARAGALALEIEWNKGAARGLDTEKMRVAMRDFAEKHDGSETRGDGNAGKAYGSATTKLAATYEAPFLAHAPMEPQNATVHVTGDRAEVWAPVQGPSVVQDMVAEAIGISRGDVLVHTTFAGGGFGRRGVADYVAQAAQIAKRVGKPVQMIWTRESDMTQGFYRPQLTAHMRGAVDNGKLTAFTSHTVGQPILLSQDVFMRAAMPIGLPNGMRKVMANTALAMFGTGSLPDFFGTEGVREFPYKTEHVKVTITPVDTGLPVCFWRSVGHSFNGFAVEGFIDELAYLAKRDPFEFRRDNLAPGSAERKVLEAVAKLASWGSPLPAGRARGIAQHMAFDTHVAEVAEIEMVGDRIAVRKVYAAIDCGVAVNPDVIRAQVEGAIIYGLSAALDQEITLTEGVVQQRNFDTFPPLRLIDCPEIVVHIVDSDDDPTGVGEPGLPPIAPAVANAVFAATGVRLRRMPLHRAWRERGPR